jgi:hypothetical protein
MGNLPAVLGTIPGWLTAGGVISLVGIVLKFINDRRRTIAQARKTTAEAEKIEAEVDDITINRLEGQIDRLDKRVRTLERQVQECHQDRDLALAAARFLWDRLNIAAPTDEAVEKLREYLEKPPTLRVPRSMTAKLAELD